MNLKFALTALQASLSPTSPTNTSPTCSPETFPYPEIFGIKILNISATETYNYTSFSLAPGTSKASSPTISFCNVSVIYEHPGWNDRVKVSVWLPLNNWNNRLQALGGGGYSATFGSMYSTQAVAAGYVAIGTDAGLGGEINIAQDPSSWALTSPGNVNLYLLENYASRSLEDVAVIGKLITKSYYGVLPKYSYFSGCSGGGRQALMVAQRYPEHYDGILSVAPAINIEKFIPAGYWATLVMQEIGYYPPPCEIDAFTQEAVKVCDSLDRLEDGIISDHHACNFTAYDVVGKSITCNNTTLQLTEQGARIVQAAWNGPSFGRLGWFGVNKGASLTTTYLKTRCAADGISNCTADTADLLSGWIKYFLTKDTTWSTSSMTRESFFQYLRQSEQSYESIISTSSPDLSSFKAAGGKIISWHGGADEAIPPNGTIAYYQQVLQVDPSVRDYYRFFEAPGVGHCIGGNGLIPNAAFDALVGWVEDGVVPDTLVAESQSGSTETRPLCPYPSRQKYIGGNNSFECVDVALEEDGDLASQFPFIHSR